MYTKLFTLLLMVCLIGTLNYSTSNDRYKSVKIVSNGDAFRGDTGPLVYGPPAPPQINNNAKMPTFTYTDGSVAIIGAEVNTNARTHYDLQANGNIRYIYQNPTDPTKIHAIFMTATDPAPGWDNRNARYFYSTTGGNTWEYIGTVTTARSGFPTLTVTNDNRAIVLAHSTDGGGLNRTQLWVDLAPGVGAWTNLDPGANGNTALAPIWPEVSIDLTNNKVLFAGSQNGVDSAFVNVCSNISSPGTFVGYKPLLNGETAEQYAPAVGTGIYGVAFNTLSGGAAYTSSIDGGVTWTAPIPIWTWNPADSIGTLRSIDLRYNGNVPQVVLGLLHVDPVGGTFVPGLWSKLVFWSPAVNGGIPVTVDSADGLNGSNSVNDVFVSVTRGVIGGISGGAIYVAYNKSRQDTNNVGNNFFDVYGRWSTDNGATWGPKTQLTNLSGQFNSLHDCRYVAISPSNASNTVHIITQADTVPASNVNGAAESWAKMYYIKITDVIGINTISTEVPANYSLSQNYPNPFNPTTKIKFAVPNAGLVTLKMYDVLGKEVSVLINKQLSAGTFEYEFNAAGLTSGVYFYRLESGNFVDTKKLVLVK